MELSKVISIPPVQRRYSSLINCTPGAQAAASPILSLLNPNPSGISLVRLRRAYLSVVFFGTATASAVAFGMRRYTHASGYTGGSAITPAKMRSNDPASEAVQRFAATGILTDPGVVAGADILSIGAPNQLVAPNTIPFDFSDYPIELEKGEGVVIYLLTASLASTSLEGSLEWDEVL